MVYPGSWPGIMRTSTSQVFRRGGRDMGTKTFLGRVRYGLPAKGGGKGLRDSGTFSGNGDGHRDQGHSTTGAH